MKGQKQQSANPELNVGNCQSAYIVLYQIAKVFKNMKFVQLMKHILNIYFSRFGGLSQYLWVSPLWFSALRYNSWTVVTRTIYKPKGTYVEPEQCGVLVCLFTKQMHINFRCHKGWLHIGKYTYMRNIPLPRIDI